MNGSSIIIAGHDDIWEENNAIDEPKQSTMNSSLDIESSTAATTTTTAIIHHDETSVPPSSLKNCCVKMWQYENVPEAKGYALLAMGRGVAVMSNGMNSNCPMKIDIISSFAGKTSLITIISHLVLIYIYAL